MTDIAHFTPELFELLRQLKRHNNRDWFARNKARYEQVVRNPALLVIAAVTPRLSRLSRKVAAGPLKGSLFRIYRDIRFSSDKRPFKTHVGIQFTLATGKDVHAPCYYLHLEPDGCFVAAGVWHPDASALTQIRSAIVSNPQQWKKVRRKIELEGDRLVRPPRGFDPAHPFVEDLKCKDYIASVDLKESQVCDPKFIPDFVSACRTLTPLVEFTARALAQKAQVADSAI
jgi:uncharacterized protein (TIGR02453 family)